MWFKLVALGTVEVLQRELAARPALITAVNPAEARISKDLPSEVLTVLGGGSTKGMNGLQTALFALADTAVVRAGASVVVHGHAPPLTRLGRSGGRSHARTLR